jgi:hypothetical protein
VFSHQLLECVLLLECALLLESVPLLECVLLHKSTASGHQSHDSSTTRERGKGAGEAGRRGGRGRGKCEKEGGGKGWEGQVVINI